MSNELREALQWIANFDDEHMSTAETLHYAMRSKARLALAARPQEPTVSQPSDVRILKDAVIAAINQYGDESGYVKAKYIQEVLTQQASQPDLSAG